MTKVLFVCMGNICRSPTAEAVFRRQVDAAGLSDKLFIDSAGTIDYHVGDGADDRAQRAASKRGYDMGNLRARQVSRDDFESFNYILAMDSYNLSLLKRLCPANFSHKLGLFMEYSKNFAVRDVPDPYYGGPEGFEIVLDMVEDAGRGLLEKIREG